MRNENRSSEGYSGGFAEGSSKARFWCRKQDATLEMVRHVWMKRRSSGAQCGPQAKASLESLLSWIHSQGLVQQE